MTSKPSPIAWKTGEQLEFLLSREEAFKRAQDGRALEPFWQKVFEDWYHQWEIPSSPSLALTYGSITEGRIMLQKEKNAKIKQWFNNRGRCSDTKGSRGDLKLDINGKRKLAALQAYCSYAWDSTLRPIVLTRWDAQKRSATFNDEDDPPPEGSSNSPDGCIPLSFKLSIARELYAKLSTEAKKEIDRRREEDRQKLYRRIPDIEDADERNAKLQVHQRNQPLVVKSINRVLTNLEDQTGCVAHVFIASVDPKGGAPSIQKFCQGSTKHGLGFETFYGEEWQGQVEDKFRQWAVRAFGEKGTERRSLFLLPKDSATPSEASSSQDPPTDTSSQNPSTEVLSKNPPTESNAVPPRKSTSRPSRARKPVPQITLGPTSSPPHVQTDPPAGTPNLGETTSFSITTNVHQLSPQVSIVPQVVQVTHMTIPEDPSTADLDTDDLSQIVTDPTRLIVASELLKVPPQRIVISRPGMGLPQLTVASRLVTASAQLVAAPSQVVPEPSQSASEHSEASTEVPMNTQLDSTSTLGPSQPLAKVVDATPNVPMPGVPYRVRNTASVTSGARSRRTSIDGAPEVMDIDATEEELAVILSDLDSDIDTEDYDDDFGINDNKSYVSSSQKTTDGCLELSPPPPNSQEQHTSVRTYPQLKVDEEDLPVWMLKKGQWRYLTSTAGGTTWEDLLKVYINQERRLEFADIGATLTNEGRPSKIKEYFQYAHQPSRGDTLIAPDFGAEVAGWWKSIQPEWRRSKPDSPEGPNPWSYILSGGSKGAFLVVLCLAWWDRSHERHIEEQKAARRAEAEAGGVATNFDDLPDHDAGWLSVVNDVTFVMQKARDCIIPTRGAPSPSRGGKRKRQEDLVTSQQVPSVKRSSRKGTKV